MTGAYLMAVRDKRRRPVEVEHLTNEERFEKFKDRPTEDIIVWLNLVCESLVRLEELYQSTPLDLDE